MDALTSSITALIAVLKWKSCSMSWVTFRIVSWITRRKARPASEPAPLGARGAVFSSGRLAWTNRHTRFRKREAPSTPRSFQSRSFSGGAAKREKRRAVSAPNGG